MEVGAPIRQQALPQPGATASALPVAAVKPVETEIPAPRSVEATGKSEAVRIDINPDAQRRAAIDSELNKRDKRWAIDERSREVIVRTIDVASGKVVAQYPDDWQLKQRAYSRAMIEKQMATQAGIDEAGGFVDAIRRQV